MAGDGRQTTSALVAGALAELREAGQAAFTMEGVARRSYYSVGSVYERWPDRTALLVDLADGAVAGELDGLLSQAGDARGLTSALVGDDGGRVLGLVGELMLAAHTSPAIVEPARALWARLQDALVGHLGPGMAWYLGTTSLGNALLGLLDIRGPGDAPAWVELVSAAAEAEGSHPPPLRTEASLGVPPLPSVPPPSRQDPVAIALIEAAQLLLAQTGAGATSTRDIAATAGVTTGALYRRYPGKAGLLADVLVTELEPDRYAWTWDLIRALASQSPYEEAAAVMADRLIESSRDVMTQRVLMQVGIAARTEAALRAQVAERIDTAQAARTLMIAHFIEAGLVRDDIPAGTYAWGFQTLPVGNRALQPLGIDIGPEQAEAAMRALMVAAARH